MSDEKIVIEYYDPEETLELIIERWKTLLKNPPIQHAFNVLEAPSEDELRELYRQLTFLVSPIIMFNFRTDTLWAFIGSTRKGEQVDILVINHILFPISTKAFEAIQIAYGKDVDRGALH